MQCICENTQTSLKWPKTAHLFDTCCIYINVINLKGLTVAVRGGSVILKGGSPNPQTCFVFVTLVGFLWVPLYATTSCKDLCDVSMWHVISTTPAIGSWTSVTLRRVMLVTWTYLSMDQMFFNRIKKKTKNKKTGWTNTTTRNTVDTKIHRQFGKSQRAAVHAPS